MGFIITRSTSIKNRINILIFFPLTISLALALAVYFFTHYQALNQDSQVKVKDHAYAISSLLGASWNSLSQHEIKTNIEYILPHVRDMREISVYNNSNVVVMKMTNPSVPNTDLITATSPIHSLVHDDWIYSQPKIDRPPPVHETILGPVVGYVTTSISTTNKRAALIKQSIIFATVTLFLLFCSALAAYFLSRNIAKPIIELTASMTNFEHLGTLDRIKIDGYGEIATIQKSFKRLAATIQSNNITLQNKIAEVTADLQVQRDWMVESNVIKTALINKLNDGVEQERKKIATELHDEFNTHLIALKLAVDQIQSRAKLVPLSEEVSSIIKYADALQVSINDLHTSIRNIYKGLRPDNLDLLGLDAAIESLVYQYNLMSTPCKFIYHSSNTELELDEEISLSIYRLIQESLSNVVKHAGATLCDIRFNLTEEKQLKIEIHDNGSSFESVQFPQGIGLIGMRERVERMHGAFEIVASKNQGTTVHILMPLAHKISAPQKHATDIKYTI